MGRLAITGGAMVLGAIVGSIVPGIGTAIGASLGAMVGSIAGSLLMPPPVGGPRVSDLRVTASTYGEAIKECWGTGRIEGNVIWCTNLIEHNEGNGKGSLAGPDAYQYTWTGAVALCRTDNTGPIADILRIWADTKLVFDKTGATNGSNSMYGNPPTGKGGSNQMGQGPGGSWYNNVGTFRIYTGTQTQVPDPAMEALLGAANCNANRGMAYVVFDNINLINYGNRVPNFTFEVAFTGSSQAQVGQAIQWNAGDTTVGAADSQGTILDPIRQRAYFQHGFFGAPSDGIKVVDLTTREEIMWADTAQLGTTGLSGGGGIVGVDGYLYLALSNGIAKIDPDALVMVGYSGNIGVTNFDSAVAISLGGQPYLIVSYLPGFNGNVQLFNCTTLAWEGNTLSNISGRSNSICPGGQLTSGSSAAFIFDLPYPGFGATSVGLYQIIASQGLPTANIGSTLVADIVPTDIDSEWTTIDGLVGPIFDATDGNLLAFFYFNGTVSGAGHSQYWLVKLNAATGAVMWKFYTANPGHNQGTLIGLPSDLPNQCSITQGVMAWAQNNASQVFQVETQNGTATYQAWSGLNVTGGQIWDDAVGAILFYGTINTLWSGAAWGVIAVNVAEADVVPVSTIVTDICEMVGFDAQDIDVSRLSGLFCEGYQLDAQMTGKGALDPLALAFWFDGVESDNTIKFVRRGTAPIFTVPSNDLAYMDKKLNALVQETRTQEVDLPNQVSVTFMDPTRDFQKSTQYFRRPSTPYPVMYSKNARTVALPLVMQPTEAKQLCEVLLFDQWVGRVGYKTKMPWKYMLYDPTDVLTLTLTDSSQVNIRVGNMTLGADMAIEMQSVAEEAEVYSPNSTAYDGLFPQNFLLPPTASKLFLFDVPLLRDIDDTGQTYTIMYYALGGYVSQWPGGAVYQSQTGTGGWNLLGQLAAPGVSWGVATNALGTPAHTFAVDNVNTLTVAMTVGGSNLSSASLLSVCNGANAALLVSATTGVVEVIQFLNVVQNANGTYTLSNLLRGRRGTDTMNNSHAIGDYFILLNLNDMGKTDMPLNAWKATLFYEGITNGNTMAGALTQPFADSFRTLMPYAPVMVSASVDGSNNINFSWVRRDRLGWNVDGDTTARFSEQQEYYQVDIYKSGSVIRTLSQNYGPPGVGVPVASPGVQYPNAEVVADFGSVPSTITVAVYQMSGDVGRGFANIVTIPT